MRRALLIVALCSLLLPSLASAKDLRKKVGIGFNNNFSAVSSLSVKVGLPTAKETVNVQLQGLVGFSLTTTSLETFFAGGRVLLPFVAEDNLNVYGAIGGGYVRFSTATAAARVQAVIGAEFFMFGLERLGFSAEFGVNLDVAPGVFEIGTTSGTAASVGVHYYFGK
ncbi:MAG: hypothetical protein GY898_18290 [Proteobacteria bacterium]|nr:hypothetical protein [Pseudomonadota bacterium]